MSNAPTPVMIDAIGEELKESKIKEKKIENEKYEIIEKKNFFT